MRILGLIIFLLATTACDRLSNQINFVRLLCGLEPDPEFSIFRIQNAEGQFIDLSSVTFEVLREDLSPVPVDQYRATRSGCLQIKKQDKAFVRLPLIGESTRTLSDRDLLNQETLIQDKTAPVLSLPVARSHFRGGETLPVTVSEASRLRYCVEAEGEGRCSLANGPRLAFESEVFQDFSGAVSLPQTEGAYRLSIVAEDRHGLTAFLEQKFIIDSTIPIVEPDFLGLAENLLFDDLMHFYVEKGYRLGFRSRSEALGRLSIAYCLLPSSDDSPACPSDVIRTYGVQSPEAMQPGAFRLLYRATDAAGNRAEDWNSLRILVKSKCSEQELSSALASPEPLTCTELVGDLSLNRVAVGDDSRLDTLISISGKISLFESDRQSIPLFKNLRKLRKIEILENYELLEINSMPSLIAVEDIDISENEALQTFSGFQKLARLRNLTISSAEEVEDFQVFASLEAIEGTLSLTYVDGLEGLDFLRSIRAIGSLKLSELKNLKSLSALASCTVSGDMELMYLDSLESLKGLGRIPSLATLRIQETGLRSLDGLDSLMLVKDIMLKENASLLTIQGPPALKKLNSLSVEGHESLGEINGFDGIEVSSLTITDNARLQSLSGWKKLSQLSSLIVQNNEALETIRMAPDLKELSYSISISGNSALKTIQGFGKLNEMDGLDISIKANLKPRDNALSRYTTPEED